MRERRIVVLAATGGGLYLLLTALEHVVHARWLGVLKVVAAGIPFLAIVQLTLTRARRNSAYARRLKLLTAFFVSWVALFFGVAFVVPGSWRWPVVIAFVVLLWLLAQLAKRLAPD